MIVGTWTLLVSLQSDRRGASYTHRRVEATDEENNLSSLMFI